MPNTSGIKKFNLTYADVPDIFGIDQTIFFDKNTEAIPDIGTMLSDINRVSYLDIEDHKVSDLKKRRLVTAQNGELALAADVSPVYTQGSDSGRLITELVYQIQYYDPRQTQGLEAPLLKAMGFIYINKQNQIAGFSLLANPTGEHSGWIIASIQNTTARPEERTVTVLATPNYITAEAQTTASMDNLDTIGQELKAVICNDRIADLIKDVFNTDGSLNATYLAELDKRLLPDQNLDDRDRKQAQLDILFSLADKLHNPALSVVWLNRVNADGINVFKTDTFESHVHALLALLDLSDDEREKLKQASELYADIYMLAEEHIYKPKDARIFMKIAEEMNDEILNHHNLTTFCNTHAWAQTYQQTKQQLDTKKKAALAARHTSLEQSFFARNFEALGYSALSGIAVGLILGLALITSPLPPLSIALLIIGTVHICFAGISAPAVYFNEKQHIEDLEQFKQESFTITNEYTDKLGLVRLDLPMAIQESSKTTLSSPPQFRTENRYTLWEKPSVHSDSDNKQTESKIPGSPPPPSQK